MKKKILISAYACEPNSSSEPKTAWDWVNLLSKKYDVEVITRSANRNKILKFLKNNNVNIKFHFYDLKGVIFRIIKGKKNSYSYLYFIIWQIIVSTKLTTFEKFNRLVFK